MIYDLHLYIANQDREPFFVDSMRNGGLYTQLARRILPGSIGMDLLRSKQDASEFLCIRFFTSANAYEAAQKSSNAAVLARFVENLTVFSANIGVYFTLPDRLIPRFPEASLTNREKELSSEDPGPSPNQAETAGNSGRDAQL
jgi:hypothetical protein